MVSGPAKG
jgi:hypothetical protein